MAWQREAEIEKLRTESISLKSKITQFHTSSRETGLRLKKERRLLQDLEKPLRNDVQLRMYYYIMVRLALYSDL